MRRVVVTGMGMLSPLACGVEESWSRILDGRSGAGRIAHFDASHLPCQIACEIPLGDGSDATFNADDWVDAKDRRKTDRFITYALTAAEQAIADAGWRPEDDEDRERTGVMIGSGVGGIESIGRDRHHAQGKGPQTGQPVLHPGRADQSLLGPGVDQIRLQGPNHAVVTACSTGAHAIGDAARLIMYDDADVMIAGGAESPVCELSVAGFSACKALSTGFNDTPERASRPYDSDRDGFVMARAPASWCSGIRARGGPGRADLCRGDRLRALGRRLSHHLAGTRWRWRLPLDARGGAVGGQAGRDLGGERYRLCQRPRHLDAARRRDRTAGGGAAARQRCRAGDDVIDQVGDRASPGARPGAVEAIFSILAIRDQVAPPTLNLDNPSVETAIDLAPHTRRDREIDVALSNSFGFGGTNASIIFGRVN